VNPLRDLWEGASLGGRELPWTSEREKGKKRKRKGRRIKSKETRKERRRRRGAKDVVWLVNYGSCRIYGRTRELEKEL
jgi:hypothetical protein